MKRIIKIFRILFILFSVIFLIAYFSLINAWKYDFTENELQTYFSEIKKSENLPDLFYKYYDLDNNNSLETKTGEYLFKSIFASEISRRPLSFWLARQMYIPKMKNRTFINRIRIELSLAMKIEKETSQKEQFNYTLSTVDFVNNQIGVKNASKFYFGKEIAELNENEIASLIIMIRNPALYNPKRRPEKLKAEVEKLLKK
ncbi:hypothetical protein SY27_16285 [Flavobacterium sp. 316]|uniref:transglycosylase domain-containing protein n=1 Tax=Flavobacterium sp. 316 TaxID=1603293 RepID=UPI0005DE5694|nr:transglycosylase domain-containing protein [Flavobacterium sp. 316]KIX20071.1 hypothetical protein SY27_16285 [Flavobacterium sp. 316]